MIGNHISLFTGVGMLDLAAEKAGFKTRVTAEPLPFCQSVLRARFPDAVHLDDVRDVNQWPMIDRHFDGRAKIARPLLVSGGSPCQGFSDSGYRGGLADPRSGLLLEMLRVVRDFVPEYVLIENSALLLKRGFDRVLVRLNALGYHVRWECIPAAHVDAPHMRDRVWIMARRTPFPVPADAVEIGDITAGAIPSELPRSGGTYFQQVWRTTPLTTRAAARQGRRLMPTPTKSDGTGGPGESPKRTGGMNLRTFAKHQEGNGRLNPVFVEWMMGLPMHWTDVRSNVSPHYGWDWREPYGLPYTLSNLRMTAPDTADRARSKRIQALGNGLVPQVASIALDILING